MTGTLDAVAAASEAPVTPRRRKSRVLIGVGVVIMLAGLLFGYDQGVIAGALTASRATSTSAPRSSRSSRAGSRSAHCSAPRRRRARRPDRAPAHTIMTAAVLFIYRRRARSVRARDRRCWSIGRLHRRVRRRRGIGGRAALRLRDGARPPPRPVRVDVSVGDHHRHLHRLRRRSGLDQQRRVAVDARRLGRFPDAARPGDLADAGVASLADQARAEQTRRVDAVCRCRAGRRRRRAGWPRSSLHRRRRRAAPRGGRCSASRLRKPLMIGVGLAVFQQITGINAIIYYANEIFGAAGFETPQEQAAATTWAVGAVNVLATFIAVAYVDRFGRKPLLLTGLVGMAVSLTVVGFCFLQPRRRDARCRGVDGGHLHPGRPRRVHRIVRLLARSGGVDGDQRDLPQPHPRSRRRRRHRGQLGERMARQPVLPDR